MNSGAVKRLTQGSFCYPRRKEAVCVSNVTTAKGLGRCDKKCVTGFATSVQSSVSFCELLLTCCPMSPYCFPEISWPGVRMRWEHVRKQCQFQMHLWFSAVNHVCERLGLVAGGPGEFSESEL